MEKMFGDILILTTYLHVQNYFIMESNQYQQRQALESHRLEHEPQPAPRSTVPMP